MNALEFSRCGGLMVSGGDDRRALLWGVDRAVSGHCRPRAMEAEHRYTRTLGSLAAS